MRSGVVAVGLNFRKLLGENSEVGNELAVRYWGSWRLPVLVKWSISIPTKGAANAAPDIINSKAPTIKVKPVLILKMLKCRCLLFETWAVIDHHLQRVASSPAFALNRVRSCSLQEGRARWNAWKRSLIWQKVNSEKHQDGRGQGGSLTN